MIQTVVCQHPHEVARRTLEQLRGPNVAISGGSTFASIFPHWVSLGTPEDVLFFPVDERMVPIDHPASNWGQARQLLFDPLGRGRDIDNFAFSAQSYQKLLRSKLKPSMVFDTVFLGVGEDGHTASLFPGSPALNDERNTVLETVNPSDGNQAKARRITLGLSVLWRAKSLVAVAMGQSKWTILQRLTQGDTSLPITLALAGHPSPILIVDRTAALNHPE